MSADLPKVFISYASKDSDFAELVGMKLEKYDIDIWKDANDINIGAEWRNEIDLGLLNSDLVIVLLNQASCNSSYVTYEWSFSLGNGKDILPVLLEDCDIHPRLDVLQYIDFRNGQRPWNFLIDRILSLHKNNVKNLQKTDVLEELSLAIKALAESTARQESRPVVSSDFTIASHQINNTRNYLRPVREKVHTILWVDDNPDDRAYERQIFESLDIVFHHAVSTSEAMKKLESFNYSAIISDMSRQEGEEEGYRLLEMVRQEKIETPFFFYTFYDGVKQRNRAISSGAQGLTRMAHELVDLVSTSLVLKR